jgi:hypothetical protein
MTKAGRESSKERSLFPVVAEPRMEGSYSVWIVFMFGIIFAQGEEARNP